MRRPALAALMCVLSMHAGAFEIDTGHEDLKLRWDNTLKYSNAWRLKSRSELLVSDARLDDGDRNFDRGLVSNRLDLLSELDLSYKDVGLRISGAGWYDSVYNRSNDHDLPSSANQISVATNAFPAGTEKMMGRKAELLDANVYARFDVAGLPSNVRLGRHTQLYGESLFFGGNGIAAGQAPVDIIKLLMVPGTKFQELLMPVNQVSGQMQLSSNLSVGAYYQFEWRENRIPAAGSYLSEADHVGEGAERFFVPGTFGGVAFLHGRDLEARDSGQWGMQLRYRPEGRDVEFGLYATRYHAKDFQIYLNPSAGAPVPGPFGSISVGDYSLVFPEGIRAYGASFSTVVAEANVAGEISLRDNTPLVSAPVVGLGFDNRGNPAYAVGKSAHAQLSAIYLLKNSPLWDAGSLLAEIAWQRRLSVDRNAAVLDPTSTRDATAIRALFTAEYYQIADGIDLSVPFGIGYLIDGRPSVDLKFGGGVEHGGDISIGATFDYRKRVKFGMNYVKFVGGANTFTIPPNGAAAVTTLSYGQTLKDRDFLSFFVQATF